MREEKESGKERRERQAYIMQRDEKEGEQREREKRKTREEEWRGEREIRTEQGIG